MRRILIACGTIIFLIKISIPAVEQVLIVQSRDDYFSTVTSKLESELSGSFNLVKLKKIRDTNEIAEIIPNLAPKAIIIFEKHAKSSSLYWFREYLQSHQAKFSNTAFIFVKDFFVDQSEVFMDNATGISFLPPVMLGVEKLQKEFHKEIHSIGIIHPRSMRKMIIENGASCILEGISLTMKTVPDRNDPSFSKAVTEALNNMKKQNVDALWMVEDESLLQLQLVRDVWEPFIKKNGIPTIVNNEALLAAPWNIGTVCIIPDPQLLSSQIAKKLHELQRDNWIVYAPSIDPLDIYSKQLKKMSVSRSTMASVSHDRKIETTTNAAPRQDTVLTTTTPPVQVASLKASDSMPVASSFAPSSPSIMPTSYETNASVKPKPTVLSDQKAVPGKQDFTSNITKQTNSNKKQSEIRIKPEPEHPEKAVTENRVQPKPPGKTITEDRVQRLPSGKILKYILITTNHAAVRQLPDTVSLVIGWALKGQQFPVFGEEGDNLQISFFNSSGWITAKDVKTVEEISSSALKKPPLKTQKYLVLIILILLNVLLAAMLIVLLMVKKPSSRSVKQASKKI
jgi:hypothetical protein